MTDEDIIQQVVSSKPWLKLLSEDEGNSTPKGMLARMTKHINKNATELLIVAKEL